MSGSNSTAQRSSGFWGGMNPYEQASQAQGNALAATTAAMRNNAADQFNSWNPYTTGATSYGAANMGASGYNAVGMQGTGYGATNMSAANQGAAQGMSAAGYNAATQGNANTIASQMGRYQNPYENQVVQSTMAQSDIDRQRAQEQNRAAAAAAGAFGGGRHGLTEAATNAEINRNLTADVAALRQQGYNTAAGLAGQDVSNQMSVAAANQAAQNAQRAYNAGNLQDARAFNAQAQNARNQFNASQQQAANAANQAAQNAARQYGADATNAARAANQAAQNAARQYNAGNKQQANAANQAAQNAARQWNAANTQQQRQANMDAVNAARQFNASGMQQQQQNQFSNALQGAAQMANLGNQSFGYGSQLNSDMLSQGQLGQDLQNALIGQAAGMFDSYTGQPSDILSMRLASLGVNPLTKTGTQTGMNSYNPGMMDYLGLAAGVGGSALGAK